MFISQAKKIQIYPWQSDKQQQHEYLETDT